VQVREKEKEGYEDKEKVQDVVRDHAPRAHPLGTPHYSLLPRSLKIDLQNMVEILPTVGNEVLPKGLKRNKLMPLASFDDYPAVLERNRRRIFKLSKLTTTEN
jgi:hypothetical protein